MKTEDDKRETALHLICQSENSTLMRLITLELKSVNFKCANCYGDTPLHIAIRLGNLSIARMIVTAGGMELLKLKNKAEKTPDQETSDKKFLELI